MSLRAMRTAARSDQIMQEAPTAASAMLPTDAPELLPAAAD